MTTKSKAEEPLRKRMRIIRAADATELGAKEMPIVGIDEKAMSAMNEMISAEVDPAAAQDVKTLFRQDGENPMSLTYAWFKSEVIVPRHMHNADCIYYILAGELRMGTQIVHPGDAVFVPSDTAYTFQAGPKGVEILEFRTRNSFDLILKGNDTNYWNKIVDVQVSSAERWSTEAKPSGQP